MTESLTLPCPAKINLFLRITGQRSDGYHELQTLFQLLDYGDTLRITRRSDGEIHLLDPIAGVAAADNLVVRAAKELQRQSGSHYGADINLHKILPMGGGIGGGSSNAASVLLGLNSLWNCGLSIEQLAELGLSLGADVPVFLHGKTAWAEGIGEILSACPQPERWYLVLKPNCNVSTKEIFCHEQLTRHASPIRIAAFLEEGSGNSCEPLVRKLYPDIDKALIWLSQFTPARLTGTGACVFASFDSEAQAREIFQQRPQNMSGFVAKSVNTSPLHTALGIA